MEISHPGVQSKQSNPLLKVLESLKRVREKIFEVWRDMDELMPYVCLPGKAQVCARGQLKIGLLV